MALTEEVGKALRFLRKRRAMTQRAVAEKAGISKNLLSNWETGTTAPSLSSLEKVMGVLRVDLLELYNAMNLMAGKPFREPRLRSFSEVGAYLSAEPPYTRVRPGIPPAESTEMVDSLRLFLGLLRMMSRAGQDTTVLEELEKILAERAPALK
jgi:transcriptional regulator with XRE-family HTH domain